MCTSLRRSPATISRELHRNLDPRQLDSYRPFTAPATGGGTSGAAGLGKLMSNPECPI